MVEILLFAAAVVLCWILVSGALKRQNEFVDKKIEDLQIAEYALADKNIEEQKTRIDHMLKKTVSRHFNTLDRKYTQLVQVDDYGTIDKYNWHKEVKKFKNEVLEKEIISFYKTYWENIAKIDDIDKILAMQIEIIIEDMRPFRVRGLAKDMGSVYYPDMPGVDFENHVADRLRKLGASVRNTAVTGDQGVDLIVKIGNRTIAVQCKRSARPIGNKAVQEAAAGHHFYGATEAWVISDASFTRSAKQLAATLNVVLLHFENLSECLNDAKAGKPH